MMKAETVSTFDALKTALKNASGGETIFLEGKDYGNVTLSHRDIGLKFSENVTIASADESNPASFSGMNLIGASNLTLDGILFDYDFDSSDPTWVSPFGFFDTKNFRIVNSEFEGDVARGVSAQEDGKGWGTGVFVRNAQDMTFENNEISTFWKGVRIIESKDIVLEGNDLHSMRLDGINFASTDTIDIVGNFIHDFVRTTLPRDHADMIQSWTVGTNEPSRNISIRDNRLDIGDGDSTQSIFLGNSATDPSMFFSNVEIENNLIVNGHRHGIALGAANGVEIRNNTLVHADGAKQDGFDGAVEIPSIGVVDRSQNVLIEKNAVNSIRADGDKPGWTVRDNVFVQDQNPRGTNFYKDVFVFSSIDTHDFVPLPGGPLDLAGAGANVAGTDFAAQYHVGAADVATRVFDASYSRADGGALPEGAAYVWDFGDGTTAEGISVEHVYADGGVFDAELRVTLPDGRVQTVSYQVKIDGPDLVRYEAGDTVKLAAEGRVEEIEPDASGRNGLAIGNGVALAIPKEGLRSLQDTGSFEIALDAVLDPGATGALFRYGGSLASWVDDNGEVTFRANLESGDRIVLTSRGADLHDGASHSIDVSLKDGALTLLVDGVEAGRAEIDEAIVGSGVHDFTLGSAWGDNADGMVEAFSITANEDSFPDAPVTTVLEASDPVGIPPVAPVDEAPVEAPPVEEAPVDEAPVEEEVPEEDTPAYVPDGGGDQEPFWQDVLTFDPKIGFYESEDGNPAALDMDYTPSGQGFSLGAEGVSARMDPAALSDLAESSGVHVGFSLETAGAEEEGHLLHMNGNALLLYVGPDGELVTRIRDEGGDRQVLVSRGADLNGDQPRDIDLLYAEDTLEIFVDGESAVSAQIEGFDASSRMFFGNPWGLENAEGVVTDFEVNHLTLDVPFEKALAGASILPEDSSMFPVA